MLGLVKCLHEGFQTPVKSHYPFPALRNAVFRSRKIPNNGDYRNWERCPDGHVSKSNNGDYRKRNPLMCSTQYSTLDHVSLLHLPTHSVPHRHSLCTKYCGIVNDRILNPRSYARGNHIINAFCTYKNIFFLNYTHHTFFCTVNTGHLC